MYNYNPNHTTQNWKMASAAVAACAQVHPGVAGIDKHMVARLAGAATTSYGGRIHHDDLEVVHYVQAADYAVKKWTELVPVADWNSVVEMAASAANKLDDIRVELYNEYLEKLRLAGDPRYHAASWG